MTRQLTAEFFGTCILLIAVIGSGIMGESLAGGNTAIALLANAIATGCALYCIITVLGPISGAHFNPAVTLAFWMRGEVPNGSAVGYILVQCIGAYIGVLLAHAMFDLSLFQTSATLHRTGTAQWMSEALATAGLLFVIFGGLHSNAQAVPTLVALYITGAYWFTASTSFANPAVTLARGFSDTFAGIYPGHIIAFVLVQIATAVLLHAPLKALFGATPKT